jgi:hypothetical protein
MKSQNITPFVLVSCNVTALRYAVTLRVCTQLKCLTNVFIYVYSAVEIGRCISAQVDCLPQGKEPSALTAGGRMSLTYAKLIRV